MNTFEYFKEQIVDILNGLAAAGVLGEIADTARISVEPPRDAKHGDISTNAAMVLAKPAGLKPRDLAIKISAALSALEEVSAVDVAGPGFINATLAPSFWHARLGEILEAGLAYGDSQMGGGRKVNIEYVSANPTGPMHVGHGRGAVVGDALASILAKAGFDVTRDEFAPDRFNVLARLKGDGSKPALIFSAHMDTLPIGDGDWGHPAFGAEIEDGKLYGRGATDMKSGLAAMAAAALKLRRADVALAGDLILAFSAGESSNLLGAERMVEAGNLKGAGALLVSEPTSLGLVTAEAGALWLRVVASGRPGHASAGTADNAILKLMDFLADVRTNPFADKPIRYSAQPPWPSTPFQAARRSI